MSLSINSRNRMICLFDCYSNLLTDKQKMLFNYYFNEDLSLAEISDIMGVSRQAVHNNINRCEEALESYESSLGLYERANAVDKVLDEAIGKIEASMITGEWSKEDYTVLLDHLKTTRKAD